MATVLKQAVDLLASLQPSYHVYGSNNPNFCDIVKKQLLKNPVTSKYMDSALERFNRDSVKKTIMKQEETFKEQVRELHRVYRVQKMLMSELRNNVPQLHSPTNVSSQSRCGETNNRTGFWTAASRSENDHAVFNCWNRSSTNEPNPGYNFQTLFSMRADTSQQEQSSSCSRENLKLSKPAEEASTDEDQAKMSIDSTSEPSLYNEGDSEVELTLSIGFGTSSKKSKQRKAQLNRELGCSSSNYHQRRQSDPCLSSVRSESSEPTNTTGSVTATCDQEGLQQQQSPWLFQSLSLHRT